MQYEIESETCELISDVTVSLDETISLEELEKAIKSLTLVKAASEDLIANEFLKATTEPQECLF